jgi:hypothetical protein
MERRRYLQMKKSQGYKTFLFYMKFQGGQPNFLVYSAQIKFF